jgi:hypothetical protein
LNPGPSDVNSLQDVSCPAPSLCVAADYAGDVVSSADPTGGPSAWEATPIADSFGPVSLDAVACPSTRLCIATDSLGEATVGTPAPPVPPHPGPTTAQLKALLARALTPAGRRARIGGLLAHRGYRFSARALEAGTLRILWFHGKPARKRVLLAGGSVKFMAAGRKQITIRLTKRGKRLLRHAKRLRITVVGTFTPTGQPSVRATKLATLIRRHGRHGRHGRRGRHGQRRRTPRVSRASTF